MNKKILALCLVVVLAVTAVTGATLAYFTDTEAENNQFVVGDMDIVLNETFDDTTPLVPGDHNEKGNHVTKVVDIENHGNTDAFVRLLIAYEDTKDVGAMAFFDMAEPYGNKGKVGDEDKFVIPSGTNDWLQIERDDGTVYTVAYVTVSKALAQGEKVEIMQSMAIKAGADNAWAEIVGDKYDVMVLAQGAQVMPGKDATECIDTAFGFTMNEKADEYVAKLFADAGLGEFEAFTYTAEGAWTAAKAGATTSGATTSAEWEAVVRDGTPYQDHAAE